MPAIVAEAGAAAEFALDEFFAAHIRNPHTRAAYFHAVYRFLAWIQSESLPLARITPGKVGNYFNQHHGSPATRRLHLAAVRAFFDVMVIRHVLPFNPAASVRGDREQVIEGKTPEITVAQARYVLKSIDAGTILDLRDKAIIGILIYTAARAGAVARLRRQHLSYDGTQWTLRFDEKGGKSREIPVRHDLQGVILAYLKAAEVVGTLDGAAPLFRSVNGITGRLTDGPISGIDICRMVKRRLRAAGLPERLSPHSFRVATITDLLTQGAPLEDVAYLAGHADPRTTRLYDRRAKQVTRNLVEKISI